MTEYKIVYGHAELRRGTFFGIGAGIDFEDFEALVLEELSNGWKCQGGVQTIQTENALALLQAMIRETPEATGG